MCNFKYICTVDTKINIIVKMTTNYNKIVPFVKYYFKAKNSKSIHSPFVFKLYTEVIKDKSSYTDYRIIDRILKRVRENKNQIEITDFGVDNKLGYEHRLERISDLYKKSSITPKYGKLLYRLTKHFKPKCIFEIGTSVGASTIYLATARNYEVIHTFEGCSSKSSIAQMLFNKFDYENINLNIGQFSKTVTEKLQNINEIDFAFIDGYHKKDATINFFEQLYTKANKNSIFVFDDIHWSKGMEEAWEIICDDKRVTVSIDLFRVGLVFFNPDFSKEHFVLKF